MEGFVNGRGIFGHWEVCIGCAVFWVVLVAMGGERVYIPSWQLEAEGIEFKMMQ